MKKILIMMMTVILMLSIAVPVTASEDTATDDIEITDYTGDPPFERNGEKVYSITAKERAVDGSFERIEDKTFLLQSSETDLHGIFAEMESETGKKDISVKVDSDKISEDGKKAEVSVNFTSRYVATSINMNEAILIKKKVVSGNEERTILLKRIPFAYSTPYYQDEHYEGFNSLEAWSGTWEYDYESGVTCKTSGTVDVYQKNPILVYKYTAQGKQGVKAFHLNPDGKFTFADGTTTLTKINHQPKAVNQISLKCKDEYLKTLKSDLLKQMAYDGDGWQMKVVFDDLVVEYDDGCYIGGSIDPIYLGHTASFKPYGKTSVITSKRSTSSIRIQWKKISDISGYCIYRSSKKTTGYKKIKTVSARTCSWIDKKRRSGTIYYYRVRPYRTITYKNYNGSTRTKNIYGTYSDPHKSGTRPGKAYASVKETGRRVKITNKVVPRATGYCFYIKQGKKGKYQKVKEYIGSRSRTYTSKKLKKGKTYYIRIRAYQQISGKKYFGEASKTKKIKI